MPSIDLFAQRSSEVYQSLSTSPDGLTEEDAKERLALYGENILAEPPGMPLWQKWARYNLQPMVLLLWLAGVIAVARAQWVTGLVIWLVVLANTGFSFWREYRAEQAVAALKRLLPAFARVMRDGKEISLPASQMVPGDVIVLAEGDNIPADARVVEEYGLRTNNTVLTGESMPARKMADASLRDDLSELEQPNLVFAGTSVVSGTGRAVVYSTGMLTQFGRIANLTQTVKEEKTALEQSMERTAKIITFAALAIGAVIFLVGSGDMGMPRSEAFILAVGLLVAVVPEGLVPTVTLTLAMAVQNLAKKGVLVKRLSAMEAVGTVSVIVTDKSGTLTQNQMTVRDVWVGGMRLAVTGVGYEPKGTISQSISPLTQHHPLAKNHSLANGTANGDLHALLTAAYLCNNSRINPPANGHPQWTCLGDQTEAALKVLAMKGGIDGAKLEHDYPRFHEIPFDARRKRMSTIHHDQGGDVVFVKGAPKEVLQLCTQIVIDGQVCPLDNQMRARILAANDDYATHTLRVLALARRPLNTRPSTYTADQVERDLIFLGLTAMMDPPRLDVSRAMKTIRSAKIRIVMATGDYGLTAASLARRVGMLTSPVPRILTGAEIEAMSDTDLQKALEEEVIFARMAPEHKLRLVDAFQARGDVVAVVGDGVNDAPALRKADVGVVMGKTGTDVAKEAADVIVMNDNFGQVVSAIEEGRAVYDNLRKFITYIFASNIPEILPFIMTALFRIPLALTVTQILAIDLGTDLFPALALGMEKPEPDVMQRPPRRKSQPIIDNHLLRRSFLWLGGIEALFCFLAFFWVYDKSGIPVPYGLMPPVDAISGRMLGVERNTYILATTVFHAGVVLAQVGNAFAVRLRRREFKQPLLFSNLYLIGGVVIEVVLILVMIYFRPVAREFDHVPLPLDYWRILLLFAPAIYLAELLRITLSHPRKRFHVGKQQGVTI